MTCPDCGGNGEIETERERRLDELHDNQIQALFEADMYREVGDEEQRKETQQMRNKTRQMANSGPSGMGGPSQVPNI